MRKQSCLSHELFSIWILRKRFLQLPLILFAVLSFSIFVLQANASEKYEYYDNYDASIETYGQYWRCQTFNSTVNFTITMVRLYLSRQNNPSGNFIVGIRATSDGLPTGTDLTNGSVVASSIPSESAALINFTLSELDITANTLYAIVARVPNGDSSNYIIWYGDDSSPSYERGYYCYSTDSGVSWSSLSGRDMRFETWGHEAYQKYEYYDAYDTDIDNLYGSNQRCQTFTSDTGFTIYRVTLFMWRYGNPTHYFYVAIKATSDGQPTGADLTNASILASTVSGTSGEMVNFDFSTSFEIQPDIMYAIVCKEPDDNESNHLYIYCDNLNPTYSGGHHCYSMDGGSSWTTLTDRDNQFETWGLGISNNAPTNDDLSLDLSGSYYKGTKTLLCAKQDYKFIHKASDADGVTDINYAQIQLDYGTKNVILRATRGTGDAWTFAEQSDPSDYVTLNVGACTHSTAGNQKTFNYYITINWAWGDSSETIGVRGYVIDSQTASDQDDYSNIFGVESQLVASSLSVNDYRCNPSQVLAFSGYWYYEDTMVPPPDGDYQIKVKLSGSQKGSTDTTLVSGAFSISGVTAETTVNPYSYTVEATYMLSAGSFNTVTVDRFKVISITADDDRRNIETTVTLDVTIKYESDSTAVTTGTFTLNSLSLAHQGSGVWRTTTAKSSVQMVTYDSVVGSGDTYGLNTVNMNSQSDSVVWDRLQVQSYSISDSRDNVNDNVDIDAVIWFDYDNTACTTATITINGYSATHLGSGNYRITRTSASVTSITYDNVSCSAETTYGITAIDQNGKSTTVIWDRAEVYVQQINASRICINATIEFRVKAWLEYDFHNLGSGDSVTANFGALTWDSYNSRFAGTKTQASVGAYNFTVVSLNEVTYGITSFLITVSDPQGIWDSLQVQSYTVVDSRVDIENNVNLDALIWFDYDDVPCTTATIAINGYSAAHQESGVYRITRSSATVTSITYNTVTASAESTYGITIVDQNGKSATVIWDRFEFISISANDTRLDVSSNFELRYKIRYDFDDVTFDSTKGSISGFSWDAGNSWWEKTVTGSSSVTSTNYDENYVSITDSTYGLTIKQDMSGVNIITDKIEVTFFANTTGPALDQSVQFSIILTRAFDSSSVTSYSYYINRNGTGFENPHTASTFTDLQSTEITYIYDFLNVTDNTYGLTAFIDPLNITVTWSNTNVAPTIGEFSAASLVYAGQYVFINATVNDNDGRTQIVNATVQLSGTIVLEWLNTSNTFSVQSDPNYFVTLNQSACLRTNLNDTAYQLSWNLKLAWNYSYATVSVIITNTKVYDNYAYGSNSQANLFTFEDDLIVASASVSPTEVLPETNVVFSGTIYYENTTTPPYDCAGITVYLELNDLLQGYTSTILSNGTWSKTMRSPANTGNKTYVVYALTDEMSVANKTVALIVMSSGPSGGSGGYTPEQPSWRPENYTYTPPSYVPSEGEAVTTTPLESMGLNILIVAIVGTMVFGLVASFVQPSKLTFASRIRVNKKSVKKDYAKRLRKPKRQKVKR